MPYVYFISQQEPEVIEKVVTILGVTDEGSEELLSLLMADDKICHIHRDLWNPVSHLMKEGEIQCKVTMEGIRVIQLLVHNEE